MADSWPRGRRPKGSPAGREPRQSGDSRDSRSARSAAQSSRPRFSRADASKGSHNKGTQRIKAVGAKALRKSTRPQPKGAQSLSQDMGWSTRRTFILVLVAGALVLTLVMPLRTYFAQLGEARRISAEYEMLLQEVEELERQKEMQSDPAYIRAEARERLGLVFPGETPYRVQFEDDAVAADEDDDLRPGSSDPWYTQLWREMSVTSESGPQREMNLPIAPVEPEAGP